MKLPLSIEPEMRSSTVTRGRIPSSRSWSLLFPLPCFVPFCILRASFLTWVSPPPPVLELTSPSTAAPASTGLVTALLGWGGAARRLHQELPSAPRGQARVSSFTNGKPRLGKALAPISAQQRPSQDLNSNLSSDSVPPTFALSPPAGCALSGMTASTA